MGSAHGSSDCYLICAVQVPASFPLLFHWPHSFCAVASCLVTVTTEHRAEVCWCPSSAAFLGHVLHLEGGSEDVAFHIVPALQLHHSPDAVGSLS